VMYRGYRREEGEVVVAENATVWEFTPFEFGSWAFGSQRSQGLLRHWNTLVVKSMTDKRMGPVTKGLTSFGKSGVAPRQSRLTKVLSYVMGTSSTLFNGAFLELNGTNTDSLITTVLEAILDSMSADETMSRESRIPSPTGRPRSTRYPTWSTSPSLTQARPTRISRLSRYSSRLVTSMRSWHLTPQPIRPILGRTARLCILPFRGRRS